MAGKLSLKSWLKKSPVPAKLRIRTDDGVRELAVETDGARRFANTEAAALAMNPNGMVEALDATGIVLRVIEVRAEEPEAESDGLVAQLMKDGEGSPVMMPASVVMLFAKLLAEASDQGASRHAGAYEMAFSKQNELLQLVVARLVGVERQVVGMINKIQKAGGVDEDNVMEQLLALAVSRAGVKVPDKANGVGKKTPPPATSEGSK